MKCTFCGAELNDDVMFCTECGRAVEATPAVSANAAVKADKDPGKVLGLIAMILGIVSAAMSLIFLPFVCCYGLGLMGYVVSFALAVAAIILGAIGSKKSKAAGYKNVMATVGLILGIVFAGIVALVVALVVLLAVLAIVFYIIYIVFLACMMGAMY